MAVLDSFADAAKIFFKDKRIMLQIQGEGNPAKVQRLHEV
jgi:hypothetical protein